MEEKFKGLDFEEVHDMLGCCKNTEEKIEIYQRLVEIGEENLCAQDGEGLFEDLNVMCSDVDLYTGSMHNLAFIYMERKEYAKAALILERALILYRMQEEFLDPDFVWQRYYTLNGLVQCYTALGNKTWAIIHEYEKRLLETKYEKLVLG